MIKLEEMKKNLLKVIEREKKGLNDRILTNVYYMRGL